MMCSSVFVETETPTAVFFSSGESRGGFGEMTIFKQRFKRWNFFFVNGMWYDLAYIFGSWKLGWWEIGAKVFVFHEVRDISLPCWFGKLMATGLRNPAVPLDAIHPLNFILCTSLLLRYTYRIHHRSVPYQRYYFQRGSFATQERANRLESHVRILPHKVFLAAINVTSCY